MAKLFISNRKTVTLCKAAILGERRMMWILVQINCFVCVKVVYGTQWALIVIYLHICCVIE